MLKNRVDATWTCFQAHTVGYTVLGNLRMRKLKTKRAVPLNAVPERLTERCSPRFRPVHRFWNQVSDTCRQAVRKRNVGP